MNVGEITNYLSSRIPVSLQEDYDNSGLQVGTPSQEVKSALLSLDVTEAILEEAISEKVDLIISHHPLIFSGLKRIADGSTTERIIAKAIRHNISIYSAHTNLDVIEGGVSHRMAEKIGLKNIRTLSEIRQNMLKLAVFAPLEKADYVRQSMFDAGAGSVGKYDQCSFNIHGEGSFRPGEGADPFIGKKGKMHFEKEIKIEVIVPVYKKTAVINAMLQAHPYEEVAYDIYNLENYMPGVGLGCIGDLEDETEAKEFLNQLANVFDASGIRYSGNTNRMLSRVAVCGGSGSSLTSEAISQGADVFVTADIKYHTFFEANDKLLITDIGHYESEKFSLEILYEIITKKFPKFAVRFSKRNTNPINYL